MRLPAAIAGAFLWVLLGVSAYGQSLGTSVLTIDTERLYEQSDFGKATEQSFGELRGQLIAENQRLETALTEEEQALVQQRQTMTAAEFRPLADAFDEKVQTIRNAQDEKLRALGDQRESARQTFFQQAIPVIAAILEDRGGTMVLDRRNVILSADAIDITLDVIARLNADYAAGKLVLPEFDPPSEP